MSGTVEGLFMNCDSCVSAFPENIQISEEGILYLIDKDCNVQEIEGVPSDIDSELPNLTWFLVMSR